MHPNCFIDSLSPAPQSQLLSLAKPMDLPQGCLLTSSDESTKYVYFLTSGVASFVVSAKDGGSAEIGMIGNEGVVGNTSLLGSYAPVADCVMQMPGAGLRLHVADMQRLFDTSAEVRFLLLQATQQQLYSISQIAACNRLHGAAERLARWLLTAADRSGNDTIPLTQEAVSQMLGTRRTTVAVVAGALQRSGFIGYQRGSVSILNREGLTAAACDCYRINKKLVDCLYSNPYRK